MSAWNFMSYESKTNLLEAVRREAAGMFALAEEPETWMAPTGAGDWQVRDVSSGSGSLRARARSARFPARPRGRPRAATTAGPIDDLACVIEFDPGSFVRTAYGRTNAGTARGDRDLAHRFLGGFFRI